MKVQCSECTEPADLIEEDKHLCWRHCTEEHDFFACMRTCREGYRRLAECIHAVLGVQRSALDVGCGVGDSTARLFELGWGIRGGEVSKVAIGMSGHKDAKGKPLLFPFDLTRPALGYGHGHAYDTVICTETAEHIAEKYEALIVLVLAMMGNAWIVFSAAHPGQDWEGQHVNLKPLAHWIRLFEAHGWAAEETLTARLRTLMWERKAQHWGATENFVVLKRVLPEAL